MTFWISAIEFLLGKTAISDVFNPIVTSHNFHFRYPQWKYIPDIQNVILNIQKYILTNKNVHNIHNIYTDVHNLIFTSHNTNCEYP